MYINTLNDDVREAQLDICELKQKIKALEEFLQILIVEVPPVSAKYVVKKVHKNNN